MNKKIMIASIVAVLASPLALARGHTQDVYGGVDMGAAALGDQGAFCDTVKTKVDLPTSTHANRTATPDDDFATGDCGDSETSIRVFAGYKVNDMISIEGFWLSSSGYATSHNGIIEFENGNNTFNGSLTISFATETDYTSFGASAVGKYEVYDNLSIKGVLGLHSYSIEPTFTAGTITNDSSVHTDKKAAVDDFRQAKVDARKDDGVSLLYGIGAEYALGGNFNVRAGYDVLSSGDESVSYLSAGASYTYSF